MFDEVLKFGAYIVDALKEYSQPIFVYLPPNSDLRGGAWAVLDTEINPRYIEMYSDPTAKAGILEPEGTVQVRFKEKDLIKTITRLDSVIIKVII